MWSRFDLLLLFLMTLNFAPLQIPLAAGLRGKTDARAKQPPALDIARDIQFDETGGVQTRKPFAGMPTAILGGGSIANPRQIVENGPERLLFTDTALYSWSARDSAWVLKGTHLAVKIAEQTLFARSEDQVDTDRAELSNTVFYCWSGTDVSAQLVKLAAVDKTTGAVILPPTVVDPGLAGSSPRLVALGTKVLLVWIRNLATSIYGLALDPANVAGSIVAPTLIVNAATISNRFDIVKIPGADAAYLATTLSPTTSYTVVKITSALALTSSTKARTCDGAIAVSIDPTGTQAQVIRGNGTNVQGDLLNASTHADIFTAQAVGTIAAGTVSHIAAAHRSVQNGGQYRCYAFWSSAEAIGAGVNWTSKFNFVDTGNTLGTQANFVRLLAPASRAFDYAGSVYVWGVFAGATSTSATGFVQQLQNTLFLFRDDATLVSKASYDSAGGLPSLLRLPGVVNIGGNQFAFCNTIRRLVPVGTNSASLGYAERAPRDILFTFDSNEARRCARLGGTLYVSGGEILQYDGTGLYEVGFHIYPWAIGASVAAAGAIPNGTYAYKATWKWPNAKGDVDRSTTATVVAATMGAGPSGFDITVNPLYTTRKIAQPPACEIWRTIVAPIAESPFYLITSGDSSVLSGSNKYIANDPTVFPLPTVHDALADTAITILQSNPENGTLLESLAPPGATIVLASDTRLFLAGVAGDPDRIWYSKQRNAFEVAAFHDALVIDVPRAGGDITAIAFLNETLIVFRQYAIYAFAGDGLDNFGEGQNYGPGRILSLDIGAVSQEAVALGPMGLVFKSSKGWQLLNRGWAIDDISDGPSAFDADTVQAIHVVESQFQIRILTDQRLIVWDYRPSVNQWCEWTIAGGLDAIIWNGTYAYLTSSTAMLEQAVFAGVTYGQDVESTWVKLNDLQGYGRVAQIMILGEFRSAFLLRIRVAYDYQSDGAGGWVYTDDFPWDANLGSTTVGGPLQVKHGPSRQQCQAIKVRLTAVSEAFRAALLTAVLPNPVQCLSGGNWNAGLAPLAPYLGERGNVVTFTCSFDAIAAGSFVIDVRDHLRWDQGAQRWVEALNNVGIRVQSRTGSAPTVGQIEAAISAGSLLCFIVSADVSPSKVLNATAMNGTTTSGQFSSGAYGPPLSEALKLTGLALLVGSHPNKLNQRLPAAQRT